MTKQVLQFRICDNHPDGREVPAVVTEKLGLNGARWELDLCQPCSDELYSAIILWGDKGTPVGSGTVFDQQRKITGPVLVTVEPVKKVSDRRIILSEEPVEAPKPIVRDEPLYPPTASRWRFTEHALQRLEERHLEEHLVLTAAERPAFVAPSKQDQDLELRTLNNITAVVNPHSCEIITAFEPTSEEDRVPELKIAGVN